MSNPRDNSQNTGRRPQQQQQQQQRGDGGNFRGGRGGGRPNNARAPFPKLNIEKEKNEQAEITKKIEGLQEQMAALTKVSREKRDANKVHKEEKEKVNKIISEIDEKKKAIEEARAQLEERIRTLRTHQRNELNRARSRLPYRPPSRKDNKPEDDAELIKYNLKEIEGKISSLEKSIATSTSLSQDKKVIADLHGLRKEKAVVKEYEAKLAELTNETVIKQLNEQLKAKKQESTNLRAELNTHYAKIKELSASLSSNYNEITNCTAERQKIQPELDKLRQEYDQLKTAINAKRKKHSDDQAEHFRKIQEDKEKRAEEKKKREEEWKKREEEKQKAIEEQVPYEEEIAQCDKLLGDLEDIAQQEKRPKKTKNDAVRFSLHTFNLFEMLSLRAPRSVSDLEKAIGEVKTKKEHFLSLQKLANERRNAKNTVKTEETNGESSSKAESPQEETESTQDKTEPEASSHSTEHSETSTQQQAPPTESAPEDDVTADQSNVTNVQDE